MKILLVDDVAYLRAVLKNILVKELGYNPDHIYEAASGKEAIKKYKDEKPTLVLCDILMPDMTGIETIDALIALDAEAKIIMCTAIGEKGRVMECVQRGAMGYVLKPPTAEVLKSAIASVMYEETAKEITEEAVVN